MRKRIFIGAQGIPAWGGAATVAYLLFERMQRDGFDVAFANLVQADEQALLRRHCAEPFGNPWSLADVSTCVIDAPVWRSHDSLSRLISACAPELLVGLHFNAALLLKLAAPQLPLVFLTTGSRLAQQLVRRGVVRDFMQFERELGLGARFARGTVDPERQIVDACERIVLHSAQMRTAFDHAYPEHAAKVHPGVVSVADLVYGEAEAYAHLAKPFAERDIDVIFVANDWRRPVKNYALAAQLAARCEGLRVHFVGHVDEKRSGAQHHGLITQRARLFELLGRAKALLCPSLVDAAPGVLFEASAMGCNVVASPNCGNFALCHEELRAPECTSAAFLERIVPALARPWQDNREQFLGGYRELVSTLAAM